MEKEFLKKQNNTLQLKLQKKQCKKNPNGINKNVQRGKKQKQCKKKPNAINGNVQKNKNSFIKLFLFSTHLTLKQYNVFFPIPDIYIMEFVIKISFSSVVIEKRV